MAWNETHSIQFLMDRFRFKHNLNGVMLCHFELFAFPAVVVVVRFFHSFIRCSGESGSGYICAPASVTNQVDV